MVIIKNMSNLLLEKDKKEIFQEFILRFVIVFLLFLFITICISAVALIPSHGLTLSRGVSISDEINVFEKTIDFRQQDSSVGILNKENSKKDSLKESEDIYVSNFISEIVGVKPSGVKIIGFFYEVNNKGDGYLVVRGESEDRNILISFVENLEKKDVFSRIDFPVSNLVKGESVNFSVKIYPN